MIVSWTAVRAHAPVASCPYVPAGTTFRQTGHAGAGRAELPTFDGIWWSVLATWPDEASARGGAPPARDVDADVWHVVLQAASFRGDALLGGGARPFAGLPERGKVAGAAAVITLAGLGPDASRTGEFFTRFVPLGIDVATAPGNRAALIQAPEDGAVLTFSAWSSLRAAVGWAYHRPEHAATVARQHDYQLLSTSGFLRCAVLSSTGSLGGRGDPLLGLTGSVVAAPPDPAQGDR